MNPQVTYPRKLDQHTVYLKNVVWGPNIVIDDFTFYNDFEKDPRDFQKNNVLYHYPINGDLLVMGGTCQRTWEHAVPKTARPTGPRISIQFRPRNVR